MDRRLERMDQYLLNSQRLLQALEDNDLEAVNRCLEKNLAIMRDYDQAEFTSAECPRANNALRAKMEAVRQANQRCQLYTEDRCRDLRNEIASTDRNRSGIIQYGAKGKQTAKFIDSRT
jgi:hypothetical protein